MRDNDLDNCGAEALPGGLREINEARGDRRPAADRVQPPTAKAPLVGLIALAELWLRKNGNRG